ncbi:MAG: nucleotidyltransferase domain-containing protein [Actinobacteria bacterium]|nr:nucleotidyltransferase domain-containing protein [Actinomycetota bacterium]
MNINRRSDSKKEEIIIILTESLSKVLTKYPVISAYLFGSYARGNAHPGSDIDIAIYIEPVSKLSLDEELTVGREVEAKSGLKPIDLRIMNDMPVTVQGEILTRGVLLYSADDKERVTYETKTLALYFDYLPHIERFRKEFLKSVEERGIL